MDRWMEREREMMDGLIDRWRGMMDVEESGKWVDGERDDG